MPVLWCSSIRWMDAALASSILYPSQLTHPTTQPSPSLPTCGGCGAGPAWPPQPARVPQTTASEEESDDTT